MKTGEWREYYNKQAKLKDNMRCDMKREHTTMAHINK
jgi:hypothetical protein